MKRQMTKWIKEYGMLLLLILTVVILAVAGSYAAYVNFSSVKRVVSTGKGSQVYFSSNYLYLVGKDETSYGMRKIAPSVTQDGNYYSVTIQVCNYVYGNTEQVNANSINYSLTVTLLSSDGGSLPAEARNVSLNGVNFGDNQAVTTSQVTLPAGQATMHSYTIQVPVAIKDSIRLQVVAVPVNDASYAAVENQKLAAILTMTELSLTNNWTGRFIDDQNVMPAGYDGLNYEISGIGEGTVTISWDPVVVQISPWFVEDLKKDIVDSAKIITGSDFCSFPVGGENQPSAYQLQFYKAGTNSFSNVISWEDMKTKVTVTYSPSQTESNDQTVE
ncbi:MAG: hypothetical protein ACI4FY_08610 [Acetatifactor sp.]